MNEDQNTDNLNVEEPKSEVVENKVENTEVTTENQPETTTENIEEKKTEEPINKHKIPGKHKLKYDSIFKGKKNDKENDEESISHRTEGFEVDRNSFEWQTKYDSEEYNRLKELKQKIYNIIVEKTEINLKANRRKPGRTDFNIYYEMLVTNLDMRIYSHSEVFIELSYYFSENEYNMFKLLEQKWGSRIVKELSTKYNINKINGVDFV